jgi:DNA invertase Pin-like site-specific DNA recombinase
MPEKKVVIYCRKATEEEAHLPSDTTLARQEETCRRYCAENDLTVVNVTQEIASGATWEERPQFTELRTKCLDGEVGCIVVATPDRLCRNRKQLSRLVAEMHAHHVSLICVKDQNALQENPFIL